MEKKTPKVVTQEKMDKFPPYKNVEEYIVSKKAVETVTKYPVWGETATLELIRVRYDHREVEARLNATRTKAQETRKSLDDQWRNLEEKERSLRSNFLYFNKFVRENMEKRERASKKAGYDRMLYEKRMSENSALIKKITNLQIMKRNMDIVLRKHFIYETFLSQASKADPDEFKSIDSILNRYEALIDTKIKLAERQEEQLKGLEQAHQQMTKLAAQSNLIIMGLNNVASRLEERFKTVNEHTLERETLVAKVMLAIIQSVREVGLTKAAVENLHKTICLKKKIDRKLNRDDYEQLLVFIKKALLEIMNANRIAKRRIGKN